MTDVPARAASPATFRTSLARRGRRLLRYGLALVTVVLVIDAIFGEKGLLQLLQARRDFAAVEQALERARVENARLRTTAGRLRDDPSSIEEIARRELGLIRPGELLFIVRDVPAAAQPQKSAGQ